MYEVMLRGKEVNEGVLRRIKVMKAMKIYESV